MIDITRSAELLQSSSTRFLSDGFKSDVFTHHDAVVLKVLGGGHRHRREQEIHLTPENALVLGRTIEAYKQILQSIGIPVPEYLSWHVLPSNGSTSVVISQPFTGHKNAKTLLREAIDENEIREIAKSILAVIEPIFSGNFIGRVGLDPIPANTVFDELGRPFYIDLIPPRFVNKGVPLVEFPPVKTRLGFWLAYWKYFTPEGMISVLLAQLCRVWPEYFHVFWQEISQWLIRIDHHETKHAVEKLFLNSHDDPNSIIQPITNTHRLRLIACQLAHRHGASREELEAVFHVTHCDDGPFDEPLKKGRELTLALIK